MRHGISILVLSWFFIACADKKAIKLEVIYSEEGYFPGHKMAQFGLRKGDKLD